MTKHTRASVTQGHRQVGPCPPHLPRKLWPSQNRWRGDGHGGRRQWATAPMIRGARGQATNLVRSSTQGWAIWWRRRYSMVTGAAAAMMSDGGGHGHTMLRGYGRWGDVIIGSWDSYDHLEASCRVADVDWRRRRRGGRHFSLSTAKGNG